MKLNTSYVIRPLIALVLAIALIIFGGRYGHKVDAVAQGDLYGSLSTMSGIVFGVIGAWIAIVYPEALRHVLDKSRSDEDEHVSVVRKLLVPMMCSTLVLGILLIGAPIVSVCRTFDWYKQNEPIWLAISFVFLEFITAFQFGALLYTLVPLGVADAVLGGRAAEKSRGRRVMGSAHKLASKKPSGNPKNDLDAQTTASEAGPAGE